MRRVVWPILVEQQVESGRQLFKSAFESLAPALRVGASKGDGRLARKGEECLCPFLFHLDIYAGR